MATQNRAQKTAVSRGRSGDPDSRISTRADHALADVDMLLGDLALHSPAAADGPAIEAAVRRRLGTPFDLTTHQFATASGCRITLLHLQTLVDLPFLQGSVLEPLASVSEGRHPDLRQLEGELLPQRATESVHTLDRAIELLLRGHALVVSSDQPGALAVDVSAYPHRNIAEPPTEMVARGPRDGFIEDLFINLGLVRMRLRSDHLRLERFDIGAVTHTQVVMGYVMGIAAPDIIAEARRRLTRVDIDGVLESGYIEEFIDDNPLSLFPSAVATERPDRVVAGLLEGDVAILVAGSPFALLVPGRLAAMMQSPEDYYNRYPMALLARTIRWTALTITSTLSAVYVAITSFHQQLLPPPLFLNFSAAREGVPIPVWVEALLMEGAFELLREAGMRMPRNLGQTVSIVGVLVVGQAAATAKIVSPVMIVIVGTTAIASFAIPDMGLANAIRLLRFPAILLAAVFGLYGLVLGVLVVLVELLNRTSFNQPFIPRGVLSANMQRWKDFWVRTPWWEMKRRPDHVRGGAKRRQPDGQMPRA